MSYPQPDPQQPTPPLAPQAPTYDPTVIAPQFSAPPASGYPYGVPMASAIPTMVAPPKRPVGMIVVSSLAALFLMVAAVMSVLFFVQRGEAGNLNQRVNELSAQTASDNTKLTSLQRDLDTSKRDLTDARADVDEITTQKKAVADCINAIYAFWDAKPGSADEKAKLKVADEKCATANKYL